MQEAHQGAAGNLTAGIGNAGALAGLPHLGCIHAFQSQGGIADPDGVAVDHESLASELTPRRPEDRSNRNRKPNR